MANVVQNVNKISSGQCPHGLPPGACPVCSVSAGSSSSKYSDKPRKAGEMTYHECLMVWNMMKSRALAQKQREHNLNLQAQNMQNFELSILNSYNKVQEFVKILSKNILTKPLGMVIKNTLLPILNLLQNIPKIINMLNTLKFEILDKLNAIYGEAKAFLKEKITKLTEFVKEKFINLFKIFKKNKSSDEDTKIDDDKKIFNLKSILRKIKLKFRKKKKRNNERNT